MLESKGSQNLIGFGSSITWEVNGDVSASLGFAYNSIMEGTIEEHAHVDTLSSSGMMLAENSNELSNLPAYSIDYSLKASNFMGLGSSIKYKNYLFSFSFQDNAEINKVIDGDDYIETFDSFLLDTLYTGNQLGISLLTDYFTAKIL